MVDNASTIVTVDLIDEIIATVDPILAMMIGIDVTIAATTAVMTDAMTTVATTGTTGATNTEAIVAMIAVMIVTTTNETTGVMIDVARTTTVPATTTARSGLHCHRPKGATPMVHSRRPTARSTSSSNVAKRSKEIDKLDQTPGRSGTSTPKTRDHCSGLNSQSLSPGKIIGSTSLAPKLIHWLSTHSQSSAPPCDVLMSEKEDDWCKTFIDFILDQLVPDDNASHDEVQTTS
jgi:hypothetical protein